MMTEEKLTITVPGSTANLGPGFDSIGLALNRYLKLEVTKSDKWNFVSTSPELEGIPAGEDNLVYQVANYVAKDRNKTLPPCHVEMTSEIPMSRGMGSSAAAIVAGIELANQLLHLDLSLKENVRYASLYEGHPDNVAASLYGGLVIGSHSEEETDLVHGIYPDVDIVGLIPSYELETKHSRSVLPKQMDYKDAVRASSVSNVLVAALMTGDWELAGKMMQKDLFHQSYRATLVPELETVLSMANDLGVYGVTLSGAGPIVLSFAPKGKGEEIQAKLKEQFKDYQVEILKVDKKGLVVEAKALA